MPLESLAHRFDVDLPDLPLRWLPLIHPYDADLPLFLVYYLHEHLDAIPANVRPSATERVFGYIERLNIDRLNAASATVVVNKDLGGIDAAYRPAIERAVRDRLGLNDPVTRDDVTSCFLSPLDSANAVLAEIWERVVTAAYGGKLPFGKLWDEVYGLCRWTASWNSQSGRKGELIQTHYAATQFGERIQSSGMFSHVDYFLLPSFRELSDPANPLAQFPRFARLVELAQLFCARFCTTITVSGVTLSRFVHPPKTGSFDSAKLFTLFRTLPPALQPTALECYNAFGKGPGRTVLFLMMLADLRANRVRPGELTPTQFGALQHGLDNTYQSPKVLQIYAQQSFGNRAAMPIDSWVNAFLKYPLNVVPVRKSKQFLEVFAHATNLGKVERLIWVAAQARKVHSSACNDALWCLKKSSETAARGANPLACTACLPSIRTHCPAHAEIKNALVCFNRPTRPGETFRVNTSAGDATTPNQSFVRCEGTNRYERVVDDYTPDDRPDGFAGFPNHSDSDEPITVETFVNTYRR